MIKAVGESTAVTGIIRTINSAGEDCYGLIRVAASARRLQIKILKAFCPLVVALPLVAALHLVVALRLGRASARGEASCGVGITAVPALLALLRSVGCVGPATFARWHGLGLVCLAARYAQE